MSCLFGANPLSDHADVIKLEHFCALLALCAGNSSVSGEFPSQRPLTRSFGVFFDLRLNKRLSKQSWGWWFETPSHRLWRHCNVNASSTGPFRKNFNETCFKIQYISYRKMHVKSCMQNGRHVVWARCANEIWYRADSRFAPSQWETALLCNGVSHWLGTSLESALWCPTTASMIISCTWSETYFRQNLFPAYLLSRHQFHAIVIFLLKSISDLDPSPDCMVNSCTQN